MEQTWRIITFNIRRSACDDGANRWEARAPHVVDWLQEQRSHIIGFQELMPDAAELLQKRLPGYDWAGCGRSDTLEDEHCCVAWRSDDFVAIRWETFWLSDTPAIPGSKFAQGNTVWPRTCTALELFSRSSKKRFRVYNTHLDNACEYSKKIGVRVLLDHITRAYEDDPLPFLLMGDFNAVPDSEVVKGMYDNSPVALTDYSLTVNHTYHGYGLDAPCKIDYLLGSSEWILDQIRLDTWHRNGIFLSDHYPVVADLLLK